MSGGYGPLAKAKPTAAGAHNGSIQLGDLGCEGVGTVVAAGADPKSVSGYDFKVGDAVMWFGYASSFREYVVLEANPPFTTGQESQLGPWKVPSPTPEWTVFPCSALTAIGGLELEGHISAGMDVLVTGAAGGTGHVAVQWAKKIWGARVAGTCGSAEKASLLEGLGCDVTVNYRTQDVAAALKAEFPQGFDLIYEGVGGRIGNIARRLLADDGFLVQIGYVGTDYSGATMGDIDGAPVELKSGQGEMCAAAR